MKLTSYSHSPRVEVSSEWEIIWNIDVDRGTKSKNPWKNSASKYSARVHKIVNTIIPTLWEELVAKYLGWTLFRGLVYDMVLCDGRKVEVKTARVWSSASVREWQLEKLSQEDLYAFIYYETTQNRKRPPSFYVDKCISEWMSIPPEVYLKRNVRLKSMFIIQRPSIMHFFNMSDLRLFHNSSWIPYKSFSRKSAMALFDENPNNAPQETCTLSFWKHEIEVFKMWESL